MSCTVCPRAELDADPQEMTMALFKRIADQARGSVGFIDFSSRGESLLCVNVFQMIAYARALGMHTSLPVNGLLLSEENCVALVNAGLDLLTVSVDAFLPETYSRIRRGGDFHAVVENIKRMARIKRRMNSPMTVVVQMVRLQENELETERFKAGWKQLRGVMVRIKPFSSRGGCVKNGIVSLKRKPAARCSRLWKTMRVYADGTAVPCCNDFLCRQPLGDLSRQSIKEVWNGKSYVTLRRQHAANQFDQTPICRDCEFLKTDLRKQLASFVLDDLTLRRLLASFDGLY
ncbi:MAG: SPASM domain-containing protein [Candidatus Omnitrophica bacterium]|nr:SPASM domain-containing protein [Candidatus Omnitrophota bacterium]